MRLAWRWVMRNTNCRARLGALFAAIGLPVFFHSAWASAQDSTAPDYSGQGYSIASVPESDRPSLEPLEYNKQPEHERKNRLDERTAYTVGAQRLKLGLLAFDYGIIDQLSIGTDPPAWAARTVLSIFVPNLHVKWRFYQKGALAFAARVGGYYASLSGETSGRLVSVPISLVGSIPITRRLLIHPDVTYVFADASGTGDLDNADANGAVAARMAQTGAMLQYQFTKVFSLTAVGRYQFYSGSLVFRGEDALDPYTRAEVDAELEPRVKHPWQAIGGAAFTWPNVNLVFGLGYGQLFVPGVSIPLPDRGLVPDFSLSVIL